MQFETKIERTAILRAILSHAGQLADLAGKKDIGSKLALTRVNLDAQLSCVFKATRRLESELLVPWAMTKLSPSPAGLAYEALVTVRLAAIAALTSPDPDPFLRLLEHHLRLHLEDRGIVPRGTIGKESAALRSVLEERNEDVGSGA